MQRLRLLHPFMPFLTEELWHQLPQKAGAKSIALDQFPENSIPLEECGSAKERWRDSGSGNRASHHSGGVEARSEKESAGGLFDR